MRQARLQEDSALRPSNQALLMSSVQPDGTSTRSLFANIVKGSSLYSIVQILPPLVSLTLVPITTRFLTKTDYGIQDLLSQVVMVVSALLGGYFGVSLGYFYYEAEPAARHNVVGTSVAGSLLLGTIACLVCFPFAGRISTLVFPHVQAGPYLQLMFLMLPASFLLDALMSWLRVANKQAAYVLGSVLRAGLTVICTVVFVAILRLHVWGVLYSTTIALSISTAVLGIYWLRSEGLAFHRTLFSRIARYAMPLGVSGMAMFILHFGDSFILPHYRSYDDLGLYRLAYKIAMLVSTIYGAFALYWNSQVFHIMRREDSDVVFARVFTYVMLGISFASLFLIVSARPALRQIAGRDFQDSAALVPILVIAYFLRSISEFMRALFLAEGRPGYEATTTWIGAVTCLGGYAVLIPRFGVWGAASATLAAFAVLVVVSMVWTYRLRPYRVEGARLAKIGIACAASGTAWLLLCGSSSASLIAAAAVSLALFPGCLWLLRFPTPGEWKLAQSTLQRGMRLMPLGRG